MLKKPSDDNAILTYIEGFDQFLKSGIPEGSVCLVIGGPGTLKTTFAFTLLHNNVRLNGNKALYISLEQSKNSLLTNMAKVGMRDFNNEALEIGDYGTLRLMMQKTLTRAKKGRTDSRGKNRNLNARESSNLITNDLNFNINWLSDIQKLIHDRVEFGNVNIIAIDSLNGLYSLVDFHNLRKELFHFFGFLREINVTTFLIVETYPNSPMVNDFSVEQFLSDGIIELGVIEDQDATRYIQVKKLRGSKHDMNKYAFKVEDGIRVWGKLFESN